METQAPEAEPPMTEMPEMERQDPAPEPEPQPRMPEMERRDAAPEPEPPEPQEPAPEPEPQPPMETKLRFGGAIYTRRRGQKRAIAKTESSSDDIHRAPSPLPSPPLLTKLRFGGPIYTRRRGQKRAIAKTESSDDIHRAPSPLPSPLRPDPGSSSSEPQALDEFMERCRIQDQKMALLFLEDLLKELKRAGLSRFMKEEPNYRSNADSIFSLLDALRFDGGCDLKKNFEDIFSLYSQYTKIISFSGEQIFMEANKDDLMTLILLEVSEKSQDEDRHTFMSISNSLHLEKMKAKQLEEEVAKVAQQINHFESRINILKDALTAAECELKRSRDERVSYETFTADTNVALLGASRAKGHWSSHQA